MFTVYHSDQLTTHKDLLIRILQNDPNPNPFEQETVLVQSLGMAQWLQMQIASEMGIAGNIQFPYPTSFLWQQYRLLFPDLPKENIFEREAMVWRLMRLIPDYLVDPIFAPLQAYLSPFDQLKLFQLAEKIADLFDQYLVYRPNWLIEWESGNLAQFFAQLKQKNAFIAKDEDQIWQDIQWQSALWNALVVDLKKDHNEIVFNTSHRAYLQQRYFEKLDNLTDQEKQQLPKRLFIFGISSLPLSQIEVLYKLAEHCRIYLFFTNPSEAYWADSQEEKVLEKLLLNQQIEIAELESLNLTDNHPLLSMWGKQGKEFLGLLTETQSQEVKLFSENHSETPNLLAQLKQGILNFENNSPLQRRENDNSIQIHACHSKMREVEVLHNQLLALFEQNPSLSPKDIIVMSADIDSYAPYIHAVFSRYTYQDPRFIPFTLSDQKMRYVDPIIASFLQLLSFKERKMTTEEILSLFDVNAIRKRFNLTEIELSTLKQWIVSAGVRFGLNKHNDEWENYNSWENGLERLLLGTSLKSTHHSWQDLLAFDESYGLSAEIVGQLAKFIDNLTAWIEFIQQPQLIGDWQIQLSTLIAQMYADNEEDSETLLLLQQTIDKMANDIQAAGFNEKITLEIIAKLFENALNQARNNLNFLMGKVNFCTLLPMRAIPFKVVCLLGMNEENFPRQQKVNSFDLMQYARQKGDRARRDDDRYLFLEALLSAQEIFYISYIGLSVKDNAEKYPSVLVSQLIDFIKDVEVVQHPMSVFSPNNMRLPCVSYDQEWLAQNQQSQPISSFLQPLVPQAGEKMPQIEMDDLIKFLQSPAKFFFNRQLGVYFEQNEAALLESENFSLSKLDEFCLLEALIQVDENKVKDFFHHQDLQGNLPVKHFAELATEKLTENIVELKTEVSQYLSQESQLIEIVQSIQLGEEKYQLVGNIPNRFNNNVVFWRVGRLRDQEIIKMWVYHLLLSLSEPHLSPLKFYYRQDQAVKYLTFLPVEKLEAGRLLSLYLRDYVEGEKTPQLVVYKQIMDYLNGEEKALKAGISPADYCQMAIEKIAGNQYADGYLPRILAQTGDTPLDFEAIHLRTVEWFGLMVQKMKGATE